MASFQQLPTELLYMVFGHVSDNLRASGRPCGFENRVPMSLLLLNRATTRAAITWVFDRPEGAHLTIDSARIIWEGRTARGAVRRRLSAGTYSSIVRNPDIRPCIRALTVNLHVIIKQTAYGGTRPWLGWNFECRVLRPSDAPPSRSALARLVRMLECLEDVHINCLVSTPADPENDPTFPRNYRPVSLLRRASFLDLITALHESQAFVTCNIVNPEVFVDSEEELLLALDCANGETEVPVYSEAATWHQPAAFRSRSIVS